MYQLWLYRRTTRVHRLAARLAVYACRQRPSPCQYTVSTASVHAPICCQAIRAHLSLSQSTPKRQNARRTQRHRYSTVPNVSWSTECGILSPMCFSRCSPEHFGVRAHCSHRVRPSNPQISCRLNPSRTVITALKCPTTAAVLGGGFVFGRIIYTIGYKTGKPSNVRYGVLV